jgi:hypothetical protein
MQHCRCRRSHNAAIERCRVRAAGIPSCNWKKYLYAQDATQQGKLDINLLNQMSTMASAQGYSLTNKVWQLCNGWLMEAKRANGSPAILFVDPKTQTLVDVDFNS